MRCIYYIDSVKHATYDIGRKDKTKDDKPLALLFTVNLKDI